MKRVVRFLIVFVVFLTVVIATAIYYTSPPLLPLSSLEVTEYHRILDKYTFERLRAKVPMASEIMLGKILKVDPDFTSYQFTFISDGKKVSGQINLPTTGDHLPAIVMVRGYVDKEIYSTGLGTRASSEAFARAGYITVAPDFLGYGLSDQESFDIFEARFEKPATVLNLIASLSSIKQADPTRIGIWGHSNGGQITVSVLEISQKAYPTVLWAPVTQAFPSSVLQYVDELPDKGAYIKGKLQEFHERYTDQDYDIASHWGDIIAEFQVHQGTADELVPESYSSSFVDSLRDNGVKVEYFIYPGGNHNFNNGSFDLAVGRSTEFFNEKLR